MRTNGSHAGRVGEVSTGVKPRKRWIQLKWLKSFINLRLTVKYQNYTTPHAHHHLFVFLIKSYFIVGLQQIIILLMD